MKTHTIKPSSIAQQPKGSVSYWSLCAFATMINGDRNPEGTSRVREGWDG